MRATTALSATGGWGHSFHLVVAILFSLVVLAYVGVFIATLISVLRAPLGTGMKIVWIVLVFTASLLGVLLWWTVGRRDAATRAPNAA